VVAARGVAFQQSFNVAQASRPGELRQNHRQQLAFCIQFGHPFIRARLGEQFIEPAPGNEFGDLTKYSILVRHGGAPSHVRFAGRFSKPRRMNAVRQRNKNPPDSRGSSPRITHREG
jgi:hypothetical protein